MAIVDRPYWEVTYSFMDETGSRSTTNFYLPATVAVADARTRAAALRDAIALVTGCQIFGQNLTLSSRENNPGVIGGAGSRVENKGLLVFSTAAGKYTRAQIPAPIPGVILGDGRLNEDAAGPAALIGELLAGGWVDSNGSDLVALAKGYQRFRSSSRAMLPSKREPDADTDA